MTCRNGLSSESIAAVLLNVKLWCNIQGTLVWPRPLKVQFYATFQDNSLRREEVGRSIPQCCASHQFLWSFGSSSRRILCRSRAEQQAVEFELVHEISETPWLISQTHSQTKCLWEAQQCDVAAPHTTTPTPQHRDRDPLSINSSQNFSFV